MFFLCIFFLKQNLQCAAHLLLARTSKRPLYFCRIPLSISASLSPIGSFLKLRTLAFSFSLNSNCFFKGQFLIPASQFSNSSSPILVLVHSAKPLKIQDLASKI